MEDSLIRAGQAQANLGQLTTLGDLGAEIRASIPRARVTEIQSSLRLGWVPLTWDVELTEAVAEHTGLDGLRRWSQESMRSSLESPLLSPVVASAIRLLGLTPRAFCRYMPAGWQHIYRGNGRFRGNASGERELELILEDPAEAFARSEAALVGLAASLEGLFAALGTESEIRYQRLSREVVFHAGWPTVGREGPRQ